MDIVCNAANKPGFAIRDDMTLYFLSLVVLDIELDGGIFSNEL